jgi:hypothetical protein
MFTGFSMCFEILELCEHTEVEHIEVEGGCEEESGLKIAILLCTY